MGKRMESWVRLHGQRWQRGAKLNRGRSEAGARGARTQTRVRGRHAWRLAVGVNQGAPKSGRQMRTRTKHIMRERARDNQDEVGGAKDAGGGLT